MKALRLGLYLLAAILAVVLALSGALWVWSGSARSLDTALAQLASWLPPDQTLEAKDVRGTVRGGGHIGWLRWQRGELSVELQDVDIAWSLRPLLGGELRLGQLTAQHLRVEDHRPPQTTPRSPPTDLRLPVRVDIPFTIATAEWVGATSVQATGLAGHYIFDSYSHTLHGGQGRIASGMYQLEGSLHALPPMALAVHARGAVQTSIPSSPTPLQVQAHAEVTGTLAGQDATLALQADLVPQPQTTRKGSRNLAQTMQAHVSARIQPWQVQPVTQAAASWQALNLAALWPQAPQTQLNGQAHINPQGAGWNAGIELHNTRSGPWDQQHLPLNQLDAQVTYLQGQWTIQSMQATGAGGRIEGHGRVIAAPPQAQGAQDSTATPQWQGSASVYGIHPDALDSRLGGAALDGQLNAQQGPSGIAFEAQLHTAPGRSTPHRPGPGARTLIDGLRFTNLHAQGVWNNPTLALSQLQVQTDDAQLQAQGTWHTVNQAFDAQLTLRVPGGQASLGGSLASTRGQGEWVLHMADAALASRWLQRVPGAPDLLNYRLLQGNAESTGRWQGGWHNQGQALQLQAHLRVPRLDLLAPGQPAEETWHLRDGQVELAGTLRALNVSTQGRVETGVQTLSLQAQAQLEGLRKGVWQARLNTALLTLQSALQPGTWTVQLNDSVNFQWKDSDSANSDFTRTLEASAGSVHLRGPVPGTAELRWQPAQWTQRGSQGQVHTQWRTQGQIAELPLAWQDLLGKSAMAHRGLQGDMVLAGQWDASSNSGTLKLNATLARTRGDLLLQTGAGEALSLRAGVRDARIVVATEGQRLSARLRWDSERAGQAQAQFSTRLQHQGGSWIWPMDAALAGSIKAQLPPLGIWSVLAPPGWRLRGTLDADVVLSGTRGAPQWSGNLAAHELAIRSVVDGIDFSHGTLRARLAGQRLEITEFSLQGAGASNGGLLSVTGSVLWRPAGAATGPPPSSLLQGLRMEWEATAQALRLSARADRRLVVSGKLSGQLRDAQLTVRGLLKADQALWVLPEDSAPKLGEDVVVHQPDAALALRPASTVRQSTPAGTGVNPDIAVILDLGPDFQVRGRGIQTRLAGKMDLQNSGRSVAPRLIGTLHTEQGIYQAYGQNLDIEQGLLRFDGPYDNPALDILAIRPNIQQRVGIQISGSAQSPVVRLYSEPDLPEAEKLAWLVLGRSGAEGGAETAVLQQAALSLLGGKGKGLSGGLAQALGLDELSVRRDSNANVDGSTSATVVLGKRLSRDFYLAYERGLSGTMGTLSIFYDLSRRFALRAQTGEQSAVDLILTLPYD